MKRLLSFVTACVLVAPAWCLELGDPAPPLNVKLWVKGDAVTLDAVKGKQIVVVEFWATWCGPCRVSIPHLTELQKQFKDKDVRIIGLSDETEDVVKPFVDDMGDRMDYAVGIDSEKLTIQSYMAAFKVSGIPHAFVVDKSGRIVWHGHPGNDLEGVLQNVIDGTHDLEKAKRFAKAQEIQDAFATMARFGEADQTKLDAMGEEIIKLGEGNASILGSFAYRVLNARNKERRNIGQAMRAAKAAYELPDGRKKAIVIDSYATALLETGKKDEAIATMRAGIAETVDKQHRPLLERRLATMEKSENAETTSGTAETTPSI